MIGNNNGADGQPARGFLRPVRSALAVFASAAHTRLHLLAVELEEERERLKQTLVLTLLFFFGLSLGFILLTIFAVALFWQQGWIYALGALAAVYLGIAIAAGVMLRRKILLHPKLFAATLNELAKDCDRLRAAWHE